MKKQWIATIAAIAAVGMMALAACGETEDDGLNKFREGYAHTAEAVTVTQEIEVLRGKLAVYDFEKAYEKTETGYEMTSTEKRLNKVDENTEEAYTVTTENDVVSAAETFNPALTLETENFKYGYEIMGDTFRGELRDGTEDEVFGFNGEHAEMEEIVLTMTLDGDNLASLSVKFRSSDYSVSILISFSYSLA